MWDGSRSERTVLPVGGAATPGRAPDSGGVAAAGPSTPRVVVHVGEPKTGTTFLQQVMWGNRAALAQHGVLLPGNRLSDHWRATQDLREVVQRPDDPIGSWAGDWDRLAAEARRTPSVGVISHELLAAADREHAARAVASLAPAEVHVVVTVRELAGLLPAEWQETVKHRNARGWHDWLADVVDDEAHQPDRRQFWFWKVHDTAALLDVWAAQLPPERVHVIPVPPPDAPPGLLWDRFASVLGLPAEPSGPAGGVDLSAARRNPSLGVVETELVRRLNEVLPERYPNFAYMDWVKERIAQRTLAKLPGAAKLQLPPEYHDRVAALADELIAALDGRGYDVVGDLAELRPRLPVATGRAPEDVGVDELFDTSLAAMRGLLLEVEAMRKRRQATPKPPRAKAALIAATERHPALYRLRVQYWHAVEAARRVRRTSRRGPGPAPR